jgi:hypothetical protein
MFACPVGVRAVSRLFSFNLCRERGFRSALVGEPFGPGDQRVQQHEALDFVIALSPGQQVIPVRVDPGGKASEGRCSCVGVAARTLGMARVRRGVARRRKPYGWLCIGVGEPLGDCP